MKTLDEVITGMTELILSGKTADVKSTVTDALHYLKHLQEYYEMSREHHEPNPPLTWDELKAMEGKPVWVVVDGKERWHIIREVSSEHLILESMLPLHRCWMNHPDGWQAYRKERK